MLSGRKAALGLSYDVNRKVLNSYAPSMARIGNHSTKPIMGEVKIRLELRAGITKWANGRARTWSSELGKMGIGRKNHRFI